MRCWWCDTEFKRTESMFCSKECRLEYRRHFGHSPMRQGNYPISRKEEKERKGLIEKARKGDETAKLKLRLKYNLTAIWNGKELVRL